MNEYKAWFDGSCGPCNPGGTAASGALVRDAEGTALLEERRLVGTGDGMSNNVAEYAAVIRVFESLDAHPPGRVIIQGDSRLVINQLNGVWKLGEGLHRTAALEARGLLERLRGRGWQVELQWIPRKQNKECDALSKRPFTDAGAMQQVQPHGA